jgi:hypothetical protein
LVIFEGVDKDLVWNSAGGPKLLQFVIIIMIFGVILGLVARWLPKVIARLIVFIGILAIFYFWINSL